MTLTIYSLDNCGYCKVAKELLNHKKIDYKEVKVPHDMTTSEFVKKYPTVKSFPLVLDENSEPIGGFTALQQWVIDRDEKEALNNQLTGLSI